MRVLIMLTTLSLFLVAGAGCTAGEAGPSLDFRPPPAQPPSFAADQGPPEARLLAGSEDVHTAALGRALMHRYNQ